MKVHLQNTLRLTLATLAVMVALGTATVWAADMCLQDDYGSVLVGKSFTFPTSGTCKSFNGYELGTNCIISGTACTANGSNLVRFNMNTSCQFGYFGTSSFYIDKLYSNVNQAGFGYACSPNPASGNWTCTQWHINTITCPASHPLN
jgi:hypothetical protein